MNFNKTSPITYVLLTVFCVILTFPVYWMIISSFKDQTTILDTSLIPTSPTIDNYFSAFEDLPIFKLLLNTFIVAIGQVIFQLVSAIGFGYALGRWEFRGKRIVYFLMTLAWIVPTQSVMIPNYIQISEMKLNGTLIGIMLPTLVTVFANLQLLEAFNSFPDSLYEAAELDGASSWQVLRQIVIPNLMPTIASVGTISFINAWNEYLWPLLVSTGDDSSTIQIGLKSYLGADVYEFGPLMAAATLACLPVLILYSVLQRGIMENMVRGGIK